MPLTERLAQALKAHRRLTGPRVPVGEGSAELRRADLPSHRGAPAKAIQELAGHVSLTTTQHYMHLSPAAKDAAIKLLEKPLELGEMLETTRGLSERPRGDA